MSDLEEQLLEWGRWCWRGDRGAPQAPTCRSIESNYVARGTVRPARLAEPSGDVGQRVQSAFVRLPLVDHRAALGAWYVHTAQAAALDYQERMESAAARTGMSPRTLDERLTEARLAIDRELKRGR